MKAQIFIANKYGKKPVSSLFPFLRRALSLRHIMDPSLMNPEEARRCRWLGFGIVKGVTDPEKNLSILAAYGKLRGGLHGELVRGYDGIGSIPFRYDTHARHLRDFGGFIRWAYFSDPGGSIGVFGVDWLSGARQRSGVACSLLAVLNIVKTAARHGIPLDAEVALLNARMCEEPRAYFLRKRAGLRTIRDWIGGAACVESYIYCRDAQVLHRGFFVVCICIPRNF